MLLADRYEARILARALPILLASCATTLQPDPSVDLAGDWEIAAVAGEPTGGGESFLLSLTPPTGWAQFGCNAGSGAARVERGWLVTGEWIVTTARCPGDRGRFERRGFEILAEPVAIERRGVFAIRLRNRRGFIDVRPLPPPRLAGTAWGILGVNGRPPPAGATISFTAQEFEAYFGCNRISGVYRQDAKRFMPGISRMTERGCAIEPEPAVSVMTYESWGFAILGRVSQIERVRPGAIRLRNEHGEILLERMP